MVWCKDKDAFFLFNSCEVKKITLLTEWKILIPVPGELVVGMKDGHTALWQQFTEAFSIFYK